MGSLPASGRIRIRLATFRLTVGDMQQALARPAAAAAIGGRRSVETQLQSAGDRLARR